MTTRWTGRSRAPLTFLTTVGAFVFAAACLFAVVPAGGVAHADDYVYNPANKVDPFLPMSLRKPNIRGVSRLQDYEIAQLELVGTVLGSEMTALILTPDPREGVLAKIGDRVGRKGGRIIAIARDKVVVRELNQELVVPGRAQKFNDVTMSLSSREKPMHKSVDTSPGQKESDKFGFPSLGEGQGATGGAGSIGAGSIGTGSSSAGSIGTGSIGTGSSSAGSIGMPPKQTPAR